MKAAVKEGREWPNIFQYSDADATQYPALQQLTPRMSDILAAREVSLSEKKPRILELSQNLSRGGVVRVSEDWIGCVVPKMRPWLTSQNRFLTGHECLRLQGISYSDGAEGHEDLLLFESTFLTDLAGNAFHAGQCAAMLVAMWTALGLAILESRDGDGDGDGVGPGGAAAAAFPEGEAAAAELLDSLWG